MENNLIKITKLEYYDLLHSYNYHHADFMAVVPILCFLADVNHAIHWNSSSGLTYLLYDKTGYYCDKDLFSIISI